MELREKVAKVIEDEFCGTVGAAHLADAILAIPEIAEALAEYGRNPALVASQSNPQAVSTKGFDPA